MIEAKRVHACGTSPETEARYSGMTRAAFDAAAPVYDETYEHLEGIRHIRHIMNGLYRSYFNPGGLLLELNCGTGIDALSLAQDGFRVLATDISPGMVAETRKKIDAAQLQSRVSAEVLSYLQLDHLEGAQFDGAFSNLGGLNCTSRLGCVAAGLARIIKPGGAFIAAVMTRVCLWETAAALARFDAEKAFRRRRPEGCLANVHGGLVQTFYFSPGEFCSAFTPYFRVLGFTGLNVFIPPPNSARAYALLGRATAALASLDTLVSRTWPFSAMGDHVAIVLRRTSS